MNNVHIMNKLLVLVVKKTRAAFVNIFFIGLVY